MWQIFYLYCEKRPKTSYDRQIVALFQEISVAKSNSAVRMLIGTLEVAVTEHAQWKYGQEYW